jgi:hypothetical protein
MDEDLFGIGQPAPHDPATGGNQVLRNAHGTNASMHAHAHAPPPAAKPTDFGNTLRNKGMQDRICEEAMTRATDQWNRQQAGIAAPNQWQLEGERPTGQVTPRPNEGFPTHQAVDAVSLYRGTIRATTEQNFTVAHAADPDGTVVVIPFRAGPRSYPAESRDICENAIIAAFKLNDEEKARIDSLTPDMSPSYSDYLRPPAMPIMFTGLRREVATALRSQGIWAVEGCGAFAATDFPPSRLLTTLGTLGNLTGKPNARDAKKVIDAMIRRLSYHERFLNYVAMGAQDMQPAISVVDHAVNILSSIKALHTEVPMNRQKRTCWKIYIDSPISDPSQWEAFREAARAPDVPTAGLGRGNWLQQAICRYCVGQDHAESTCPFKHVPGWYDTDDIAKARLPDAEDEADNDRQPEQSGPNHRGTRRGRGQGPSRGNRARGRGRGRRGGQNEYY